MRAVVTLLILSGLSCLSVWAQASEESLPKAPEKLPHQLHLEEYQAIGLETEEEWDAYHRQVSQPNSDSNINQKDNDIPSPNGSPASRTSSCNLTHAVYGWHPYWMGTSYNNYDWDRLSTFCYFSYELNPSTGNYNTIHSWKTTNSINQAQAAGTKVELCVTNFGGTNNTTFLTNPTARQTLIDSLIVLVNYRNANGVNIDFEGIPGSQRNNLTSFMQDLSNQLKTAIPGATVTMAIFSVDWNNVFDIAALDPYVDQFIIMGYGYYYSGSSNAGPTAPLYSGAIWWSYNLNRTIMYYLDEGVTPSKLLLGLPYYGMEWNTNNPTYPDAQTGYISSRTYSYAKNNYEGTYPKTTDQHSISNAYIFQVAGQWRQSWVEDEWSLGKKFDIIKHRGIGGMGIWALGYDNGYTELWDMIGDKFSDCGTEYCLDTLYDSGGPLGNHRNNEDYNFTVQSPNGQKVRAEFLSFDMETGWDYVYVFDGSDTSATLLGQFDGNVPPGPFISTGDALSFRFTSDGATTRAGFALKWECEGPTFYADTIRLDRNDSALIDCGRAYHVFYDSDAVAGDYDANENNTMTFCASDTAQAVRMSFLMQTAPTQLDIKSTTQGNDYLYVWDGPDTTANPVAVYTGSTSNYPQPGTILSSGSCLTARFQSDNFLNGNGWQGTIRCTSPMVDQGVSVVSQLAPLQFEDSGGAGNYGNNERFYKTYCPDGLALLSNQVVWADFGPIEIEQNYDYLHVYDGPSLASRLMATFTGNAADSNDLQIIKATNENPSGCLTFAFTSDEATTRGGWSANMTVGAPRLAYGSDACSNATLINQAGRPFAGSTTLATGLPNSEDPPLNISLTTLPECSGANTITRLENSIWYTFSTPSTICPNSQIDLELQNIACQNSIPGGNGAQFMIYEAVTCQNGPAWGNPVYCSDKLLQNFPVNIAGLLQPSSTYYILIDGFAGQHCNLDLILTGDINGCILPIELLAFNGEMGTDQIDLYWETGAEQNNAGFFVQRGYSGNGHELEFSDIGFVDAAPNAQGNGNYEFSDPGYSRGQSNFYRLRQVDLDGQSHFHRVVEIRDPEAGTLTIFPNPTNGTITVDFGSITQEAGSFELFDIQGKLIQNRNWSAGSALSNIRLDLGKLPSGIYFYRALINNQSSRGRILRQ